MKTKLSPIEEECKEALLFVAEVAQHPMGQKVFADMMGRVRMALIHLENKEFGCASGKHTGACHCTGEGPGECVR